MDERANIALALKQGYRFHVVEYGTGEVHKPDGTIYTIDRWECTCETTQKDKNRLYGGACKHVRWMQRIKPCEECGQQAWLCEYRVIWTIPTGEYVQEKPGKAWRCANGHTFEEATV